MPLRLWCPWAKCATASWGQYRASSAMEESLPVCPFLLMTVFCLYIPRIRLGNLEWESWLGNRWNFVAAKPHTWPLVWKGTSACFFGRERGLKYLRTAFTGTKKKELNIKESHAKENRFQVWSLRFSNPFMVKKILKHGQCSLQSQLLFPVSVSHFIWCLVWIPIIIIKFSGKHQITFSKNNYLTLLLFSWHSCFPVIH